MATYREREKRWAHDKRIPGTKQKVTGYGATPDEAVKDAELKAKERSTLLTHTFRGKVATVHEVAMNYWYPAKVIQLGRDSDTLKRYLQNWNNFIGPAVGQRPVSEITRQECILFVAKLQNTPRKLKSGKGAHKTQMLSPKSIHSIHSVLHQILHEAKLNRLIDFNPASDIPLPELPEKRERVMTPEEIRAVLDGVEGTNLSAPVFLALILGLCRGEVLGLKWTDLDRQTGELHIRKQLKDKKGQGGLVEVEKLKTKNRRRTLHLTPWMVEEIDRRGDLDSDRICTRNGGPYIPDTLTEDWSAYAAQIGLSDWTFHDLRHGAAGLLGQASGDILQIMSVLGHNRPDTSMIYTSVHADQRRRASESITEILNRQK